MQRAHLTTSLLAAAAALAIVGCGKEDKPQTKPADPAPAPTATKPADPAPPAPAEPEAKVDADYVWVYASHAEKKPGDPVKVAFETFAVTKAEFDPANLEGASAELEIDLGSLSSGIPKRDGHIKHTDYLDVATHPKAVIKVGDVVKKGDKTYAAKAEVGLHGVTKTLPVEFEVLSADADSVRVKATHVFSRNDFGIGKADGDSVASDLKVEMQLTLNKG